MPPQLGLSGIQRPDVPVLGVKGGRGPPSGLSLTRKYPSSPKPGVLAQPASPSSSNLPQIRLGLKLGCDEIDGMAEVLGFPEGTEDVDGMADILGSDEGCDEMDGIAERVGEMDGMLLGSDDGSNDTEGCDERVGLDDGSNDTEGWRDTVGLMLGKFDSAHTVSQKNLS